MKLFNSLKKSLSDAKMKMVLAERKDEYVYDSFLEEMCAMSIGDDRTISSYMNVNFSVCDMDQVLGFVQTSLIVKKRLLVINCQKLNALTKKVGDKKSKKEKVPNFDEALLKALAITKMDIVVVISVVDLDKRSSLYKKIQSDGVFLECKALEPKQVKELITSNLKEHGMTMAPDVVDMFLSYVDMDCSIILSELNKLALLELKSVKQKDIETYVTKSHSFVVYELVNTMADKNAGKAMDIFHNLIGTSTPMQIIVFLGTQWHRMYCIRVSKGDISKQLNMNPYFMKKYKEQAKAFKVSKLERGICAILDCERSLKRDNVNEELLLETLILELCL